MAERWPPIVGYVYRVGRTLYGSRILMRLDTAERYADRYGGVAVAVRLAHDSLLTEGERTERTG